MFELICRIPENFGWTIVGALATMTCVLAVKAVATLVKEYREAKAEEEEELIED